MGGVWWFKPEGHKINGIQQELLVCSLSVSFTVGCKLIWRSCRSVFVYWATWQYVNTENRTLDFHRCETLKSRMMFCFRDVSRVTAIQWVHWITLVISTRDSVSVGLAWPGRGVMSANRISMDSLCLAANHVNVTRLDLLLFSVTPLDSAQWVEWKDIL